MFIKLKSLVVFLFLGCFVSIHAEEPIHHAVNARIREEGFLRSQVMEHLRTLCDAHGPRVTGTPEYLKAAQWAKEQLAQWGIKKSRLESFYDNERGWQADAYRVELTAPYYMPVIGCPAAFTRSTDGDVKGVPLLIDAFDKKAMNRWKGKLEGRILILPEARPMGTIITGILSDELLDEVSKTTSTYIPNTIGYGNPKTFLTRLKEDKENAGQANHREKMITFWDEQGVAAVLEPSTMKHGIVRVGGIGSDKQDGVISAPYFVIAREHHARIIRLLEMGREPVLTLRLKSRFFSNPDYHVNLIADLGGRDKKLRKQIVFIGAHLDAWHAASGAADNATGIAVIMEAVRILKALNLETKRTIRLGFWGGEEQGLKGSFGYSHTHLGDMLKGDWKDEVSNISVYLNLDHGAGRIRGIYLQGNESARRIFEGLFEPFTDLGAGTTTLLNSCGTDHEVFDAFNIPAFQFINDPLIDYTHQWHSSMDFVELIDEENLKQQAVIVASVLYHAAMREDMFPRKLSPGC